MPAVFNGSNGKRRRMSKGDRKAARDKTARDFDGTLSERAGRSVIRRLRDKTLKGGE